MAEYPDDPAVPAQLLRVLDRAGVPVARLHPDGLVIGANPAFTLACGRPSGAVVGAHLMDLVVAEDRPILLDLLASISAEPEDVHVADVRLDALDGRGRSVELHTAALGSDPTTVVCVVRPTTDAARRRRSPADRPAGPATAPVVAPADGSALEDLVAAAATRTAHKGLVYAVLLCQLDDGDAPLDDVMAVCAERISSRLRGSDAVVRVAPDALAVLAEDLNDEQDAAGVAYRVLSTVVEAVEVREGHEQVRMSVGVAVGDGGTPPDAMLPAATRAAEEAMAGGSGGFRLADERSGGPAGS